MRPEFLCHLPFVRLETGAVAPLANDARLESLSFEDWLALEDPAMEYYDRRYREVAPVFVRGLLPDGTTAGRLDEEQEKAAEEIIEQAHTAVILTAPATPIPPPSLSAGYVVWRGLPCDPPDADNCFCPPYLDPVPVVDDDGFQLGRITVWLQQAGTGGAHEQWIVERRFGPAQREWLLARHAREGIVLSADKVQAFVRQFGRLSQARWGPRRAAAGRCAEALTTLSSTPELNPEGVVLLVAALENLVNARADRPLGDTFARRCAAWFAENAGERMRDVGRFRRLYGTRSEILHGTDPATALRDMASAIDATPHAEILNWLRLHAWLAVDYLIGWYARHADDDAGATQFQAALAQAANETDEEWKNQRARIVEGRTYARG